MAIKQNPFHNTKKDNSALIMTLWNVLTFHVFVLHFILFEEFSHIYSIITVIICVMIIPLRNLKLLNVFYKTNLNLQQSALRGLKSLSCQQRNFDGAFITSVMNKTCLSVNCSQVRRYANFSPKPAEREDNLKKKFDDQRNDNDDNKDMPDHGHGRTLPRLMNFPEIMWPSMLNSIKNWIMVQFIIRPYMDREFNIRDFCSGAKKAMQVRELQIV